MKLKFKPLSCRFIAEHTCFWMMLLFLTVGCTARLYQRASEEGERSVPSGAYPAASGRIFQYSADKEKKYRAGNREIPIYCVKTEKPQAALSFDAAWGNEETGLLLEILKRHGVKATFFMTGGWVKQYPEDVKAIAAAGHDLGNHSENHKNMGRLSREEIRTEISRVHEQVKRLTGKDMELFRPPYGDYNDDVIEIADSLGYYPVQWDVDSLDWKDYGADAIVSQILNHPHLGNGSIILMHNGAKYTPEALEAVITGLQEKGLELVPISSLIWPEGYHIDPEGRQISNSH